MTTFIYIPGGGGVRIGMGMCFMTTFIYILGALEQVWACVLTPFVF